MGFPDITVSYDIPEAAIPNTCIYLYTHLRGEGKMGADQSFSSYFRTAWNAVMWGLWGLVYTGKISLIHVSFPTMFARTRGYPRLLSWNQFRTEAALPWSAQSSWVQSLSGVVSTSLVWVTATKSLLLNQDNLWQNWLKSYCLLLMGSIWKKQLERMVRGIFIFFLTVQNK